jgi:hypothetical protein
MALLPLLAEFNDYGTLIFWSAIGAICVVPSISYYLYRWRKSELDAELKRDMIARGMSADEIERVLAAGTPSKSEKH